MIKNIILDMGNVLMDYNPHIILSQSCETEADQKLIEKELFNGPEWVAGDLGEMGNDERYETVARRVPQRLYPALKQCVYTWQDTMLPIEKAQKFVAYVKARGYHLYILSNATDEFDDYFPRFAEPSIFDGIVVSAKVHMIKPDPRIYTYLLEKYGLIAEESLFIDDRKNNVEAAINLGIQAVIYKDDFEEIIREFKL